MNRWHQDIVFAVAAVSACAFALDARAKVIVHSLKSRGRPAQAAMGARLRNALERLLLAAVVARVVLGEEATIFA